MHGWPACQTYTDVADHFRLLKRIDRHCAIASRPTRLSMDDVWLSSFTANPVIDVDPPRTVASHVLLQQRGPLVRLCCGPMVASPNQHGAGH